MKVNELQNSKFENLMTSSLDDVIKIAKMTKILYILDDVIALKQFFRLKVLFCDKTHPPYFQEPII